MLNSAPVTKDNLKVLGLLVRYKRVKLGFSLRYLGEIANISHTMISNFERGIMIPNQETIKDLFKVLNLDFYDEHKVLKDFNRKYTKIFNHILYYEYDEASILINELERHKDIFENSKEVINYAIIRSLYYIITMRNVAEKDIIINKYEIVLDFFSDNQKQLFYFIKGLDYLNNEYYKEARIYFEKALYIGDSDLDLLINEHYAIALDKSDKFIDARRINDECILEYEKKTNYIRAMRCRTRIALVYIRKLKINDAKDILNFVNDFAIKYKVKDLENRCNTRLAQIAIKEKDYDLCEQYLSKVTPEYAKVYYYLRFNYIFHKGSKKEYINFYDQIMKEDWVKKHIKSFNIFKIMIMAYIDDYMDKKEYEKLLNEQTAIALKSDDAEMLEFLTVFKIRYYKEERQYKNALEGAETMLHYLKYGA